MLGGLYDASKCNDTFLPIIMQLFETGQDFATVHTRILEEYEKGIPPISNAI